MRYVVIVTTSAYLARLLTDVAGGACAFECVRGCSFVSFYGYDADVCVFVFVTVRGQPLSGSLVRFVR